MQSMAPVRALRREHALWAQLRRAHRCARGLLCSAPPRALGDATFAQCLAPCTIRATRAGALRAARRRTGRRTHRPYSLLSLGCPLRVPLRLTPPPRTQPPSTTREYCVLYETALACDRSFVHLLQRLAALGMTALRLAKACLLGSKRPTHIIMRVPNMPRVIGIKVPPLEREPLRALLHAARRNHWAEDALVRDVRIVVPQYFEKLASRCEGGMDARAAAELDMGVYRHCTLSVDDLHRAALVA